MPKLNSRGEWCAGIGGGTVSANGKTISTPAGGACWLDDDTVLYQTSASGSYILETYNVRTAARATVSTRGANNIVAGGSRWAAWLGGYGVYGVYGASGVTPPVNAVAGVSAAGRDGTIAITESYQAGLGFTLISPAGVQTTGPNVAAYNLNVLSATTACWIGGGGRQGPIGVFGVTAPAQVSASVYGVKMVSVNGVWWVFYGGSTAGGGAYVGHPASDASSPTIIHTEHVDRQYGFDAVVVGSRIYYVYALGEGEAPGEIVTGWIDVETGNTGTGGGTGTSTGTGTTSAGGVTISSSATFQVAGGTTAAVQLTLPVLPVWPVESGYGRIIHPTIGAFDYETKPDEWMNIDTDVIIPPVWASTRTMTGAANVLWNGDIRDVVVEERWKALGGLAMPISQLRMLLMIWTNPIDPAEDYVRWYPNYISPLGFQVLPISVQVGGQGVTFDDVINYKDAEGDPDGWVTNPVTFQMKLVGRL